MWVSQDAYRGDTQNPITLARYTFVGNNPINQRDIKGFLFERAGNWLSGRGWKTNKQVDAESKNNQETIIVMGGEEDSGRVWSNFIDAAQVRLKKMDRDSELQLTLLIFEEPYRSRATAENKEEQYYLDIMRSKIKKVNKNVNIEYVGTKDEFINYINTGDKTGKENNRADLPIKSWEYFGHGTSDWLGVEYAYGTSPNPEEEISISDIQRFDPNAFVNQPYFKSWGCNTANGDDSWLVNYHERIGGMAVGANKKTDYAPVGGWFKSLPVVVEGGDWITLEEKYSGGGDGGGSGGGW